jgi:hypothetical protein
LSGGKPLSSRNRKCAAENVHYRPKDMPRMVRVVDEKTDKVS